MNLFFPVNGAFKAYLPERHEVDVNSPFRNLTCSLSTGPLNKFFGFSRSNSSYKKRHFLLVDGALFHLEDKNLFSLPLRA